MSPKRKPPIGSLVLIEGEDIAGDLNSDKEPGTIHFRAVGWVRKWNKREVVLASMVWDGLKSTDWGAFPAGCVTSCKVLRRAG